MLDRVIKFKPVGSSSDDGDGGGGDRARDERIWYK
jgi:hypothetical protein